MLKMTNPRLALFSCTRFSVFTFQFSPLTTPSNRNPQGVTMPRDLRPIAAGVAEVARATFIFHLSTLTTPPNRNPRGTTLPCCARPIAAGAVEVAFATFHFLGRHIGLPLHRTKPRTCHFDDRRNLNKLSSLHFQLSTFWAPTGVPLRFRLQH